MKGLEFLGGDAKPRLLSNLLMITARKNLHLSSRSFHTAPRQVRGRVRAYLNTVSVQKQSRGFAPPSTASCLRTSSMVSSRCFPMSLAKCSVTDLSGAGRTDLKYCKFRPEKAKPPATLFSFTKKRSRFTKKR